MKNNKQYKPSMSVGEQIFLIAYLMFGFFLLFAAEYHIGCWPGRYMYAPMCSEYCYLGVDMSQFMQQDERVMKQADPLVPCLPY